MKSFLKYSSIALILSTSLLLTCKNDELKDIGFPRVHTNFVEMISDTGAVFSGEIIDMPSGSEIIDHGFVWSDNKDAVNYMEKVSLGNRSEKGSFQASANRAMTEGKTYYFKAFIKTPKITVFGNELSFVSLGSHAPIITSLSSDSGSWNDTIIIRGKFFGVNRNKMNILFNNTFADTYTFESDNLIKVNVPYGLDTTISKVSIRFDNVIYPSDKLFKLTPNVKITSIDPASGGWKSVIKIKGKNIRLAQKIFFDNILVTSILKSDSVIEVNVPSSLNKESSEISIKVNSFEFKSPQKFSLELGKINSLNPQNGTVGSQVTINTKNIRTAIAKVSVGGIDAIVKSKTDSSITIIMPQLSKSGSFLIAIKDDLFQIVSKELFIYQIPEIVSLSEAAWGDTLIIKGANFDLYKNWQIYFGTLNYKYETGSIEYIDDKTIRVLIAQNHLYKNNKIHLEADNFKFSTPLDFKIPDPVISEIINPTDDQHIEFTVIGKYFHPTNTLITIEGISDKINIISQSKSKIICQMPILLRGQYSIKAEIFGSSFSGGNYTIKKNCLIWNSPLSLYYKYNNIQIAGYFTKGIDNIGFVLSNRIDLNYTQLKFDHYQKKMTVIDNILPKIDQPAVFNIGKKSYICSGITADYSPLKTFYEFDPLSQIYKKLDDFPGTPRAHAVAVSMNNKGYIFGGYYKGAIVNELWEYDFDNDKWTYLNNTSLDPQPNTYAYAHDNYIYLFNKFNIWKFDPINNSLVNISTAPCLSDQYFTPLPFYAKNERIYFQIGRGYSFDECIYFDLQSKVWKKVLNFPIKNKYISNSYNIDNKCYLVTSTYDQSHSIEILEFDPAYVP